MTQFKVQHERWKCIACSACVSMVPESWEMSSEDGFADLKGAKRRDVSQGVLTELMTDEAIAKQNEQAGDVCPVACIHVIKMDSKPQCLTHARCDRAHQ